SALRSRALLLPLTPPPRTGTATLRRRTWPRATSSLSSPPPPVMEASAYKFGPYRIDAREVFHATPLSYAMVNLRPLLPGKNLYDCPNFPLPNFCSIFTSTSESQCISRNCL
uniref:Uncharacterized protein n=1 Tax=Aegilops tauschii subsp. strangulata TaxID=200361 RepID=A0A453KCZ0_AEGTS